MKNNMQYTLWLDTSKNKHKLLSNVTRHEIVEYLGFSFSHREIVEIENSGCAYIGSGLWVTHPQWIVTISLPGYLPNDSVGFFHKDNALQHIRDTIREYHEDDYPIDLWQSLYSKHTQQGIIAYVGQFVIELFYTENEIT